MRLSSAWFVGLTFDPRRVLFGLRNFIRLFCFEYLNIVWFSSMDRSDLEFWLWICVIWVPALSVNFLFEGTRDPNRCVCRSNYSKNTRLLKTPSDWSQLLESESHRYSDWSCVLPGLRGRIWDCGSCLLEASLRSYIRAVMFLLIWPTRHFS